MRKVSRIVVGGLIVLLVACGQKPVPKGRVLLVVRDGSADLEYMILNEVDIMVKSLSEANMETIVASSSGEAISVGKATLIPDLKLENVKVSDYNGIILPCLATTLAMPDVKQIVKAAAAEKIPIAAADGAVRVLSVSGLLKGRRFATDPELAGSIKDGTNMGTGVVQDGLLITAGTCPNDRFDKTRKDCTKELTIKFIRAVREKVERQKHNEIRT